MSGILEFAAIKSEHDAEGGEIRACRGCLATGLPLFNIREKGLAQVFGEFTGIQVVSGDGYPQMLCSCCKYLLNKFFHFRMRCHSAMYLLQQMHLSNVKVTTDSLTTAERGHLKLNLLTTETQSIHLDGSIDTPIQDVQIISNVAQKPITNDPDLAFDEDDDKPLLVREIIYDNQLKNEKNGDQINEDIDFFDNNEAFDDDDDLPIEVIKKRRTVKEKISKNSKSNNKIVEKKARLRARKKAAPMKVKKEIETKRSDDKVVKKEYTVDDEQEILKTIANILRRIWLENKSSKISAMWELVYAESQREFEGDTNMRNWDSWPLDQQIRQYLYLTRKLSKFYNAEVKFLSVADHKKEIEERRSSEKYANAPFKCEYCCKIYIFEDTYKRHMMSHDPSSGDVECEICHYRFKSRKRYMNHFHIYHTKKIVCRECGIINRAWNFAKQHHKWHGGATTVCEQCGKHFPDKKLYCMHIRSVHREVLATTLCLLCGDTYNGPTGLRMHMDKTHRQAERCRSCNNQFASEEALSTHEAASSNGCQGLSPCPMCGNNFENDEMMRKHYDNNHRNEYICPTCGKVLETLTQYTRHSRKCKLPRAYRRQIRARSAGGSRGGPGGTAGDKQLYNLKLMCELCGKGNFKCYSTLRSHQRVHTGERPFACHVCNKAFRELQFLKNHMKTHTDERRYKCPYCAKAFRQLGHRAAHILTHTKERPFACETCSKRYTGQTALKEHVNTAHRGLPPRPRGRNKDKQEL